MPSLAIHSDMITPAIAAELVSLCPFSSIRYNSGTLEIDSGCKMCKLCVNKGPAGAITLKDSLRPAMMKKDEWRGVAVYVECHDGRIHNVSKELIGKARDLAAVTGHPVYALLIGSGVEEAARSLLRFGADKVFVYDYPELKWFLLEPYANAFSSFIKEIKPSSILVGATNIGRSLAPRVAARFHTGLTADCTALEMKENSDLVQIRPAFGGNLMAQIVTPKNRPQLCTVRYKIFSQPAETDHPEGIIVPLKLPSEKRTSAIQILSMQDQVKEIDISEANVLVAMGRGIRKKEDIAMVDKLAGILGAQTACTRPLIENGWFDPRRQIGLSGRTVGADLIITVGISGAVQFAAGIRGCNCIIAVNSDPNAAIFDIAHYAVVGDLYKILPDLIVRCVEVQNRGA